MKTCWPVIVLRSFFLLRFSFHNFHHQFFFAHKFIFCFFIQYCCWCFFYVLWFSYDFFFLGSFNKCPVRIHTYIYTRKIDTENQQGARERNKKKTIEQAKKATTTKFYSRKILKGARETHSLQIYMALAARARVYACKSVPVYVCFFVC